MLEGLDHLDFKWVIKVEDGPILRNVLDRISTDYFHILVLVQSLPGLPSDVLVDFYPDNLVSRVMSQPPVDYRPRPQPTSTGTSESRIPFSNIFDRAW